MDIPRDIAFCTTPIAPEDGEPLLPATIGGMHPNYTYRAEWDPAMAECEETPQPSLTDHRYSGTFLVRAFD